MKPTMFAVAVAAAALICVTPAPVLAQSPDADRAAIEKALRDYVAVVDEREPAAAKRAFHPTAPLASVSRGGALTLMTQDQWLERVSRIPADAAKRKADIVMIDQQGVAAVARVDITAPDGAKSTDYFALLKTADGWKITHKLLSVPL